MITRKYSKFYPSGGSPSGGGSLGDHRLPNTPFSLPYSNFLNQSSSKTSSDTEHPLYLEMAQAYRLAAGEQVEKAQAIPRAIKRKKSSNLIENALSSLKRVSSLLPIFGRKSPKPSSYRTPVREIASDSLSGSFISPSKEAFPEISDDQQFQKNTQHQQENAMAFAIVAVVTWLVKQKIIKDDGEAFSHCTFELFCDLSDEASSAYTRPKKLNVLLDKLNDSFVQNQDKQRAELIDVVVAIAIKVRPFLAPDAPWQAVFTLASSWKSSQELEALRQVGGGIVRDEQGSLSFDDTMTMDASALREAQALDEEVAIDDVHPALFDVLRYKEYSDAWFNDNEISSFLTALLGKKQEKSLLLLDACIIAPPTELTPSQLRSNLEFALDARSPTEDKPVTVLAPLNIGGDHWVLGEFIFDTSTEVKVTYFDPLMSSSLGQVQREHYLTDPAVLPSGYAFLKKNVGIIPGKQQDAFTCGDRVVCEILKRTGLFFDADSQAAQLLNVLEKYPEKLRQFVCHSIKALGLVEPLQDDTIFNVADLPTAKSEIIHDSGAPDIKKIDELTSVDGPKIASMSASVGSVKRYTESYKPVSFTGSFSENITQSAISDTDDAQQSAKVAAELDEANKAIKLKVPYSPLVSAGELAVDDRSPLQIHFAYRWWSNGCVDDVLAKASVKEQRHSKLKNRFNNQGAKEVDNRDEHAIVSALVRRYSSAALNQAMINGWLRVSAIVHDDKSNQFVIYCQASKELDSANLTSFVLDEEAYQLARMDVPSVNIESDKYNRLALRDSDNEENNSQPSCAGDVSDFEYVYEDTRDLKKMDDMVQQIISKNNLVSRKKTETDKKDVRETQKEERKKLNDEFQACQGRLLRHSYPKHSKNLVEFKRLQKSRAVLPEVLGVDLLAACFRSEEFALDPASENQAQVLGGMQAAVFLDTRSSVTILDQQVEACRTAESQGRSAQVEKFKRLVDEKSYFFPLAQALSSLSLLAEKEISPDGLLDFQFLAEDFVNGSVGDRERNNVSGSSSSANLLNSMKSSLGDKILWGHDFLVLQAKEKQYQLSQEKTGLIDALSMPFDAVIHGKDDPWFDEKFDKLSKGNEERFGRYCDVFLREVQQAKETGVHSLAYSEALPKAEELVKQWCAKFQKDKSTAQALLVEEKKLVKPCSELSKQCKEYKDQEQQQKQDLSKLYAPFDEVSQTRIVLREEASGRLVVADLQLKVDERHLIDKAQQFKKIVALEKQLVISKTKVTMLIAGRDKAREAALAAVPGFHEGRLKALDQQNNLLLEIQENLSRRPAIDRLEAEISQFRKSVSAFQEEIQRIQTLAFAGRDYSAWLLQRKGALDALLKDFFKNTRRFRALNKEPEHDYTSRRRDILEDQCAIVRELNSALMVKLDDSFQSSSEQVLQDKPLVFPYPKQQENKQQWRDRACAEIQGNFGATKEQAVFDLLALLKKHFSENTKKAPLLDCAKIAGRFDAYFTGKTGCVELADSLKILVTEVLKKEIERIVVENNRLLQVVKNPDCDAKVTAKRQRKHQKQVANKQKVGDLLVLLVKLHTSAKNLLEKIRTSEATLMTNLQKGREIKVISLKHAKRALELSLLDEWQKGVTKLDACRDGLKELEQSLEDHVAKTAESEMDAQARKDANATTEKIEKKLETHAMRLVELEPQQDALLNRLYVSEADMQVMRNNNLKTLLERKRQNQKVLYKRKQDLQKLKGKSFVNMKMSHIAREAQRKINENIHNADIVACKRGKEPLERQIQQFVMSYKKVSARQEELSVVKSSNASMAFPLSWLNCDDLDVAVAQLSPSDASVIKLTSEQFYYAGLCRLKLDLRGIDQEITRLLPRCAAFCAVEDKYWKLFSSDLNSRPSAKLLKQLKALRRNIRTRLTVVQQEMEALKYDPAELKATQKQVDDARKERRLDQRIIDFMAEYDQEQVHIDSNDTALKGVFRKVQDRDSLLNALSQLQTLYLKHGFEARKKRDSRQNKLAQQSCQQAIFMLRGLKDQCGLLPVLDEGGCTQYDSINYSDFSLYQPTAGTKEEKKAKEGAAETVCALLDDYFDSGQQEATASKTLEELITILKGLANKKNTTRLRRLIKEEITSLTQYVFHTEMNIDAFERYSKRTIVNRDFVAYACSAKNALTKLKSKELSDVACLGRLEKIQGKVRGNKHASLLQGLLTTEINTLRRYVGQYCPANIGALLDYQKLKINLKRRTRNAIAQRVHALLVALRKGKKSPKMCLTLLKQEKAKVDKRATKLAAIIQDEIALLDVYCAADSSSFDRTDNYVRLCSSLGLGDKSTVTAAAAAMDLTKVEALLDRHVRDVEDLRFLLGSPDDILRTIMAAMEQNGYWDPRKIEVTLRVTQKLLAKTKQDPSCKDRAAFFERALYMRKEFNEQQPGFWRSFDFPASADDLCGLFQAMVDAAYLDAKAEDRQLRFLQDFSKSNFVNRFYDKASQFASEPALKKLNLFLQNKIALTVNGIAANYLHVADKQADVSLDDFGVFQEKLDQFFDKNFLVAALIDSSALASGLNNCVTAYLGAIEESASTDLQCATLKQLFLDGSLLHVTTRPKETITGSNGKHAYWTTESKVYYYPAHESCSEEVLSLIDALISNGHSQPLSDLLQSVAKEAKKVMRPYLRHIVDKFLETFQVTRVGLSTLKAAVACKDFLTSDQHDRLLVKIEACMTQATATKQWPMINALAESDAIRAYYQSKRPSSGEQPTNTFLLFFSKCFEDNGITAKALRDKHCFRACSAFHLDTLHAHLEDLNACLSFGETVKKCMPIINAINCKLPMVTAKTAFEETTAFYLAAIKKEDADVSQVQKKYIADLRSMLKDILHHPSDCTQGKLREKLGDNVEWALEEIVKYSSAADLIRDVFLLDSRILSQSDDKNIQATLREIDKEAVAHWRRGSKKKTSEESVKERRTPWFFVVQHSAKRRFSSRPEARRVMLSLLGRLYTALGRHKRDFKNEQFDTLILLWQEKIRDYHVGKLEALSKEPVFYRKLLRRWKEGIQQAGVLAVQAARSILNDAALDEEAKKALNEKRSSLDSETAILVEAMDFLWVAKMTGLDDTGAYKEFQTRLNVLTQGLYLLVSSYAEEAVGNSWVQGLLQLLETLQHALSQWKQVVKQAPLDANVSPSTLMNQKEQKEPLHKEKQAYYLSPLEDELYAEFMRAKDQLAFGLQEVVRCELEYMGCAPKVVKSILRVATMLRTAKISQQAVQGKHYDKQVEHYRAQLKSRLAAVVEEEDINEMSEMLTTAVQLSAQLITNLRELDGHPDKFAEIFDRCSAISQNAIYAKNQKARFAKVFKALRARANFYNIRQAKEDNVNRLLIRSQYIATDFNMGSVERVRRWVDIARLLKADGCKKDFASTLGVPQNNTVLRTVLAETKISKEVASQLDRTQQLLQVCRRVGCLKDKACDVASKMDFLAEVRNCISGWPKQEAPLYCPCDEGQRQAMQDAGLDLSNYENLRVSISAQVKEKLSGLLNRKSSDVLSHYSSVVLTLKDADLKKSAKALLLQNLEVRTTSWQERRTALPLLDRSTFELLERVFPGKNTKGFGQAALLGWCYVRELQAILNDAKQDLIDDKVFSLSKFALHGYRKIDAAIYFMASPERRRTWGNLQSWLGELAKRLPKRKTGLFASPKKKDAAASKRTQAISQLRGYVASLMRAIAQKARVCTEDDRAKYDALLSQKVISLQGVQTLLASGSTFHRLRLFERLLSVVKEVDVDIQRAIQTCYETEIGRTLSDYGQCLDGLYFQEQKKLQVCGAATWDYVYPVMSEKAKAAHLSLLEQQYSKVLADKMHPMHGVVSKRVNAASSGGAEDGDNCYLESCNKVLWKLRESILKGKNHAVETRSKRPISDNDVQRLNGQLPESTPLQEKKASTSTERSRASSYTRRR
jgi:hypothetical protein